MAGQLSHQSKTSLGTKRATIEYALLLGVSIGVPLMAAPFRMAHTLVAPQDAMNGMARVCAAWLCLGLCSLGGLVVLFASVRWFTIRLNRWMLILPVCSLVALYLLFERENAELSNETAMRTWLARNQVLLDAIADAALSDSPPKLPMLIDKVTIVSAEPLPDYGVVLYTALSVSNPSRWGYVRLPGITADDRDAAAVGIPDTRTETNTVTRLTGSWFVLYDVYTFIKRGWS